MCHSFIKHNSLIIQICISFLLHLGLIVIPKSATESRILENLKATEITLMSEDIARLKGIDKNCRLFKFTNFLPPGMTFDMLWDTKEDEAYEINS